MKFQTNLFKPSVKCISFDMIIYLLVGCIYILPYPFINIDWKWELIFNALYLTLVCAIYVIEIIISALLCAINRNISFCLSTFPLLDLFSLVICQIFDGGGNLMSWEVFMIVLIFYKTGASIYKYRKYETLLKK